VASLEKQKYQNNCKSEFLRHKQDTNTDFFNPVMSFEYTSEAHPSEGASNELEPKDNLSHLYSNESNDCGGKRKPIQSKTPRIKKKLLP